MSCAQAGSSTASPEVNHVRVNQEAEFRFEVDPSNTVTVTLITGTAEIFGAELALKRAYSFCGTKQAVFSWHGCSLEVHGKCSHCYVASETPMRSYLQLHAELESRRSTATAAGGHAPNVLVAGPADSGKSSLWRMLANYSAKCGHTTLLVDLDYAQGELAVPGCLTAVPATQPLDVEGGTEHLALLAGWLGHTTAAERPAHFRRLTRTLAQSVQSKLKEDAKTHDGGCIINTAGFVDGVGYEFLLQQISDFKADILIVIGDDRLHSQLRNYAAAQPAPQPSVIKLSKSGGVITRSAECRKAEQDGRLREYFYGVNSELFPHRTVVAWDAIQVFCIDVPPQPPMSALPIGMKLPQDQLAAQRLTPAQFPSLVHSILGLVYSETDSCDDLLNACAAGFVFVDSVDVEHQTMTLLAPSLGELPSNRYLLGSIKWRA